MVEAERFQTLVGEIQESAYARYPTLSRQSVLDAVDDFLSGSSGDNG
jgi:hypothetical protein